MTQTTRDRGPERGQILEKLQNLEILLAPTIRPTIRPTISCHNLPATGIGRPNRTQEALQVFHFPNSTVLLLLVNSRKREGWKSIFIMAIPGRQKGRTVCLRHFQAEVLRKLV